MCGSNKDDDTGLALEDGRSGDMEDEGKCSNPAKTFLLIFNFIIWVGSCALLGFGIFAVVDSPFTRNVLDGNMMLLASAVLIGVGAIGFLISFIGCCGAVTSNKCLIMTYIVVLIILLAVLLIGGLLGFFFRNRLQASATDTMINSLKKYDRDNQQSIATQSWDSMQKTLECCGVFKYTDWETYNTDFQSSQKFPESCCVLGSDNQPRSGCTSGNSRSEFFSADDEGCHEKLVTFIEGKMPIVAIVIAVVALFMIFGVILGLVVFKRL